MGVIVGVNESSDRIHETHTNAPNPQWELRPRSWGGVPGFRRLGVINQT
ncbi:hypothetical protein [Coleofasciculus sp. H7-2]